MPTTHRQHDNIAGAQHASSTRLDTTHPASSSSVLRAKLVSRPPAAAAAAAAAADLVRIGSCSDSLELDRLRTRQSTTTTAAAAAASASATRFKCLS